MPLFSIQLNVKKYSDMWCPFGRINLQKIDKGGADVTPASFNSVITGNDGKLYLSSRCQGEVCPFYKPPFLGKIGWGACTHGKPASSFWTALPLWIIAGTFLVVAYFKWWAV